MTGLEAQVRRMSDLAWAAGVLDARGAFVALERKSHPGSYTPRIRVRGSNYAVRQLEQVQAIFGGSVGAVRNRREWQLSGALRVAAALDDLMPFLRVKTREAQLLREVCREMLENRSRPFDERSLSIEQMRRRHQLVEALQTARVPNL